MKKNIFYIFIFMLSAINNSSVFAQVPVTDSQSIAQTAKEYIQTATRWTQQVQQYQNLYANAQSQLAAITNVTNISSAISSANNSISSISQVSSLLQNPQKIITDGFSALPSNIQSVYTSYGLASSCDKLKTEKEKKSCEGNIALMALRQQQNASSILQLQNRVSNISKIASKMSAATTLKEAQDYQNQLNVELSLMKVDQQAIDIQNNQLQLQEKLLQAQAQQNQLNNLNSNLNAMGLSTNNSLLFK